MLIYGEYDNTGVGAGSILQILGTIHAQQVTIFGSAKNNDVITVSRGDATPTTIETYAGNTQVNVQALGATATVYCGSGNDTINVGSLAPATGGVLDPITASLDILGGAGANVLNVDDSGSNVARTGALGSFQFLGATFYDVTGLGMTGGGITYLNIAAVNVALGGGSNALTVSATIPGSTAIFAGGGPDTVNVQAISGPTTLWGSTGNLTTNVGSTQPVAGGIVDNISGPLFVIGGSGTNVLNVDDSGSVSSKSGTLTSSTITGLNMAAGITYSGMANVNVALGQGSEFFTIASTDTGTTSVQCGNGADLVDIDTTRGTTNVSGGAGQDTVNVVSTGATTTINAGSGNALINIFSVGGPTTVNNTAATATVNIQTINGPTTVNGDGRDVINVGSLAPQTGGVVSAIESPLVINGARGMDIVNVDATGSLLPEAGTLTATTLTGLGMPFGITYGNLAALTISLGLGGDNFTVASTHAGSTLINAGAGTNRFDVQAIGGNTLIVGGAGNDAFTVGSLSAATARTVKTINGLLMLVGGAGSNSIAVTADVDFTLANSSLQLSNGEAIGMSGITQATLTGGPSDNTFDVSGWTGSATINGGGGLDKIVSAVDAGAVLTDTSLTRSNGGSFVLGGIGAAIISGGASNETLDATGFSGTAWLYGGTGNDTLLAGSGDDYLDGGTGSDILVGGAGNDVLVGIHGAGDTLTAGSGDTTIYGSPFADSIQGGAGDDLIYGDGGNDTINAGSGNDTIVGGSGSAAIYAGTGSDQIFDGGTGTIYANSGGAATVDTIYGSGQDTIYAGQANDIIYNQGGTNTINGGGPGTQVYNVAAGTVPLPTPGTIPTPPNWPPPLAAGAATLPTGADAQGRWSALAGSATGGGLSNSPAQAVESSVVAGPSGQYVAWSDSRDGQYEIYVAEHTSSGWQQLAGSAQNGGISNTIGAARRPSIALNASGEPMVAYTVFNGTASDIYVAQYDPTANGGAGGWDALGTSLAVGGISDSGTADDAMITETAAGPVVAWLNTAGGVANVFVAQFTGGTWSALGSGATSGMGVSASSSSVSNLALTTDDTKVAVAWTQTVNATQQIYVRQYSGGTWNQLAGSASGNGISNSRGQAVSPTLAYSGGNLFAAWQDNAGGIDQIYAAMFNGTAWVPAGSGANRGGGVSLSLGPASQPLLSSNDGQLFLAWIDNEFPSAPGNGAAVYVKSWNGSAFVEQVPGDASFDGIANRLGSVQAAALAVDPSGHPFVSWSEMDSGSSQINVLGNTFTLGTIHYVNSGTSDDVFTTASGNDGNSGLLPSSPKLTLQGVLSDATHPLHAGDVILVDSGTYPGAVNLSSVPAGVLVLGAPTGASTISGPVTATGAAGLTLANFFLSGGETFTGTSQLALYGDTITGTGVALSGGSAIQLVNDNISTSGTAITISGGANGVTIDYDSISSGQQDVAVTGSGATGLDVRADQLAGAGTGIALAAVAGGTISGNDISTGTIGLSITAAFTGTISANIIHNAQTGVSYQAAAALSGNSIHDNATGVVSNVAAVASALGFVGSTQPDQVFDNSTGVQLNSATMQNQHVYDNALGVSGSGVLGGSDLNYANLLEANTVTVNFSGFIQYNRITRKTVGIEAQSGQVIAYNLLYRNTQAAIDVNGQSAVHIVNNTLYAPTGDNVDIHGGSSETELLNNIFWAQSGYDINVAYDSQNGYFSDYNDLYASGTGILVHWDINFTDILDWQDDVAQFDLHSEGTTVLNPTLDRPRFAGLAVDDFQVIGPFAGVRNSSPTVNAGDPVTDEALPASFQNLLTNPGFESGLTGWTASPSGGTQSASPTPFQGGSYFFAGPNAVVTLDQTVSLTASGITTAQIDAGNQILVFGGRIRSAVKTPTDSGSISITFYDGSSNVISTTTDNADNLSSRWELVGSRIAIPAGARTARFRFTAVRNSGSANQSYLDGAFVYVQSDSLALDQGGYGDANLAGKAGNTPLLRLISPDLYTNWLENVPQPIQWESLGNVNDTSVRIDLYQDGPNGPQFLSNITPATPDTGQYVWTAANSGIAYGTYGLRIEISLVGSPSVFDRSTEDFTVPENTNTFYVGSTSGTFGDIYADAPGSNRHDGRIPSQPMPYPNNVLRYYTLGPSDTLYVDNGSYPLLYPLVVANITGITRRRPSLLPGPTRRGSSPR